MLETKRHKRHVLQRQTSQTSPGTAVSFDVLRYTLRYLDVRGLQVVTVKAERHLEETDTPRSSPQHGEIIAESSPSHRSGGLLSSFCDCGLNKGPLRRLYVDSMSDVVTPCVTHCITLCHTWSNRMVKL